MHNIIQKFTNVALNILKKNQRKLLIHSNTSIRLQNTLRNSNLRKISLSRTDQSIINLLQLKICLNCPKIKNV